MGSDRFVGRIPGTILLIVGAMGAGVQSVELWNDIVGSYPFKVMDYAYFSRIGNLIALVAWIVPTGLGFFVLVGTRSLQYLAGIIPPILCPILFVILFLAHLSASPYRDQLSDMNGISGQTIGEDYLEFSLDALDMVMPVIIPYIVVAILIGIMDLLSRQAHARSSDPHPPPRP